MLLNCSTIINMELGENQKLTQPQEGTPNPNPQPTNVNLEIDQGLMSLRSIVQELRSTRELSQFSMVTLLDVIVSSITSAQGKLTIISEYMSRMFKFYGTGLDRNQVRDLGISKQGDVSFY